MPMTREEFERLNRQMTDQLAGIAGQQVPPSSPEITNWPERRATARREATEGRKADSNRIRNYIFDKVEQFTGRPETAGAVSSAADFLPGVGDVSGFEDARGAFASGHPLIGTGLAALGVAGLVPMSDFATEAAGAALRAAARAGEAVAPVFKGVPNVPANRVEFLDDMLRGKAAAGPHGAAVDVRSTPEDYAGERMFKTNSGSRFSVNPSGEISSVVKQVDDPNAGLAKEALEMARNNDGDWLSVFDTKVAEKYADAGFRPVKRMPFVDEYAPEGWDYEAFGKYNGGRPDVVFMEYDPTYKGGYKAGSGVGDYTDSYDGTVAEMSARSLVRRDPREMGRKVLERRAEIVDMPTKSRPKAVEDLRQMGSTPEAYGRSMPEQKTIAVPPRRMPGTPKVRPYPGGDRVRPFIDRQEEIAQELAKRAKPHMGTAAQYFYHTGPIIEAAQRAGMDPVEARTAFNRFADYYAATSPRTSTENNLRNASLAYWKHTQGIPIDEILGPGTTKLRPGAKKVGKGKVQPPEDIVRGIGEKGYPMMTGFDEETGDMGIHALRLSELENGGAGPSMLTNTKPYTFAGNVKGNLQGVTVDTHAIRGAISAMNELQPGSVPEGWIQKKYRAAYKKDPSSLDVATMIDDKLKVAPEGGFEGQVEYGPISDVYKRMGEILGVSPAEAQSLGWFGSGAQTGLASEVKTVSELLDDRVAVTAKEMGLKPEQVLTRFLRGQMPLLSTGGAAAVGLPAWMLMRDDQRKKGKRNGADRS